MRPWWAVPILVGGCGPVMPASDRVPMSGDAATTDGEPHTKPGSSAPNDDDGGGENSSDEGSLKLDVAGAGETGSECPYSVDVVALPTAIELLVDVSQSMATQSADHDGDPKTPEITRWSMLAPELAEHLPTLAEHAEIGLQFFPAPDAPAPPMVAACDAAVGPGPDASVDELLGELPMASSTFMLGATPMASAFASANWRLQLVDADRPRYIVVLTDGAPNCGAEDLPPASFDEIDEAAYGWAEYAHGMDITTFVVAIDVPPGELGGGPEGEPYANHQQVLQSIAIAGGSDLFFADTANTLHFTLGILEQAITSCRVRVPDDLIGEWWFYAELDGTEYYEISMDQCPHSDGFAFVEYDQLDTIELCHNACATFRSTGTATLTRDCSSGDGPIAE